MRLAATISPQKHMAFTSFWGNNRAKKYRSCYNEQQLTCIIVSIVLVLVRKTHVSLESCVWYT